jgi:hypothetical protein
MKNFHNVIKGMALVTILSVLTLGCQSPAGSSSSGPETGNISGSVFYQNETNHGGIAITLEKTDGLRTVSAVNSVRAGRVLLNEENEAYTVSSADGSYNFDAVPEGTYTIYASSNKSK